MNRDQKAAVIAEIADQIRESEAVFAVDYRGISVTQAAELRTKLRDSDSSFRIVKNTLTERAADEAGADALKGLLEGPTAFTFVRGDAAGAAKALADFQKATELLAFKGGLMEGDAVDADQIRAISKLPSRDVLYGQLVGLIASPITGLARTLNALIGGLAIALAGVQEKKESEPVAEAAAGGSDAGEAGEADGVPAGEAPAAPAAEEAPAAEAEAPAADEAPAAEAQAPAAEPESTEEPAASAEADQDAEAPEPPASSEEPAEGPDDETTTEANPEE